MVLYPKPSYNEGSNEEVPTVRGIMGIMYFFLSTVLFVLDFSCDLLFYLQTLLMLTYSALFSWKATIFDFIEKCLIFIQKGY